MFPSALDLLPFIDQSIIRIGFVRPDNAQHLAQMLADMPGQHPYAVARGFRKAGDQLTHAEKASVGIRKSMFYSREAFNGLTELGRLRARDAYDVTLLDAMFRYFRHRTIVSARSLDVPYTFEPSPSHSDCPGCERLRGTRIRENEAAALPPDDCRREACSLVLMVDADFLHGSG